MLSISILMHKSVAALALGVAAASSNLSMKQASIPIIIFVLSTPLGMLVGLGLEPTEGLTYVIINTLSAGTFVYVSCSEIIEAEFSKSCANRWLQFAAVLSGGLIISLLSMVGGHEHQEHV